MRLGLEMLLAEASLALVVPYLAAMPESVSPDFTVCVDGVEVVLAEEDFEEEDDAEVCLVEAGSVRFWPPRMRLGLEMLLAEASLALVVPYLAAMPESVSPDFTVCVDGVEVVLVEEDFEEEDDEEDCLVEVVRVSFWPTRMRLGLEMLLAEADR